MVRTEESNHHGFAHLSLAPPMPAQLVVKEYFQACTQSVLFLAKTSRCPILTVNLGVHASGAARLIMAAGAMMLMPLSLLKLPLE